MVFGNIDTQVVDTIRKHTFESCISTATDSSSPPI